jgi:hypothetical protein
MATSDAADCGVVTTRTSAWGRIWPIEIAMSPVPGGMSMSSTSRSPKNTSVRNCCTVRCSIGPRQATTASPSRRNMPMEMVFTPCATGGSIRSSMRVGCVPAGIPSRPGIENPCTSASTSPTASP